MGNQSGWRKVSTKYHEDLANAVATYKGDVLTSAEIAGIVRSVPGMQKDAQFIYPSDHCVNHTNDGACDCAMTDRAIFVQIRRGEYRIR